MTSYILARFIKLNRGKCKLERKKRKLSRLLLGINVYKIMNGYYKHCM